MSFKIVRGRRMDLMGIQLDTKQRHCHRELRERFHPVDFDAGQMLYEEEFTEKEKVIWDRIEAERNQAVIHGLHGHRTRTKKTVGQQPNSRTGRRRGSAKAPLSRTDHRQQSLWRQPVREFSCSRRPLMLPTGQNGKHGRTSQRRRRRL